jgi:hypothetical protein
MQQWSHSLAVLENAMSLYRFKSRETADLVMLEPHGRRILEVLGKDLSSGIIQPNEMPAAASALHEAAEAEERMQKQECEEARLKGDPEPAFDPVTFRLRCVPFVEMMQRCEKAQVEIVWGV